MLLHENRYAGPGRSSQNYTLFFKTKRAVDIKSRMQNYYYFGRNLDVARFTGVHALADVGTICTSEKGAGGEGGEESLRPPSPSPPLR